MDALKKNDDCYFYYYSSCMKEVNQLASSLYASGTNLSRSVSSVGEHQSEAYVSPTLPKRAETFGGFDNANKELLQACINKAYVLAISKKQPASKEEQMNSSTLHGSPDSSVDKGQSGSPKPPAVPWRSALLATVPTGVLGSPNLGDSGSCDVPHLLTLGQEQQLAAGEACPFRHEPSALGIEIVCNYWKQGNCFKSHCNFRHMEVRKNRNVIPCYWESQPSGCRKPHCPFQHKNSRDGVQSDNEACKDLILPVGSSNLREERGSSADQDDGDSLPANFVSSPPVDPIVVNVEEESDNESMPSTTPIKRIVTHIKTLEQIRLERIQAESAAFYHYDSLPEEGDVRDKSPAASRPQQQQQLVSDLNMRLNTRRPQQNSNGDIKVLTLEEIRERKRRREEELKLELESDSSRSLSPPAITKKLRATEVKKVEPASTVKRTKPIRAVKSEPSSPEKRATIKTTTPETSPSLTRRIALVKNKESTTPPPKKRAHSPVVFDLSEKSPKQVRVVEPPVRKSPVKPMVAVAAMKRPQVDDNEKSRTPPVSPSGKDWQRDSMSDDNQSCSPKENNISPLVRSPRTREQSPSTDTASKTTRRTWRQSKLTKPEKQEDTVSTKKIKLRKNSLTEVSNLSTETTSIPEVISRVESTTSDFPKQNEIPLKVDISPCNLTKRSERPCSLDIASNSDLDLSLLSPETEHSETGMSRGADDILQDIDALLDD
ncbi:hypothetical protein B566_EDAN005251 [Ephemera danica]|nr:hypothetical protein B566_EDAN005251 [Ephemera danica]